jgi:hypothetical protein
MPQKPRPYRIQVKLDCEEYEVLAARAIALGTTRSQVVRDALRKASAEDGAPRTGELSRAEALKLLAERARESSAVAAASLARELRLAPLDAPELDRHPVAGPVRAADVPAWALRGELRVVK